MRKNLALMGALLMASASKDMSPILDELPPHKLGKNQGHKWGSVNRQGSRPTKKTNLRSCKLKAKHKKRLKMKSKR